MNETNELIAPAISTHVGIGLREVYKIYNDSGFSLILFSIFGSKWFICFVGVILNLDLVFITYRTKTLRGSCNIQIAINGISITIMELSASVPFYLTASGKNFLSLVPCAFFQAIPWFCTVFTNGNGLTIGIDRLLSVLCPIWYMQEDKTWLVVSMISINSIYASGFMALGIYTAIIRPMDAVICVPVDLVQEYGTLASSVLLTVNSISVFCYIVVWITMAVRKTTNRNQKSINKSLSLIVLLELSGWIANYGIRIVLTATGIEIMQTWYIIQIATIFPYLATTLSPLVLYIYSLEYQKAFFAQFVSLKKLFRKNSVGTSTKNVLVAQRKEASNVCAISNYCPQKSQFLFPKNEYKDQNLR